MKYLLIVLLFLITGCSNTNLNLEHIKSVEYKETSLIEEDYEKIKQELQNIKFDCSNKLDIEGNLLKIVTNNDLYEIYISDNYYMELKKNDKYCSTKDVKVKEIYKNLNTLVSKYNDKNFYNITYTDKYNENELDEIIKIDKNNNYIIINTIYDLYNFSINKIKPNENGYEEIDLIYKKDFVNSGNIVIRKDDFTDIKISFLNKYNYMINIIPYVENDELKFKQEFMQKK